MHSRPRSRHSFLVEFAGSAAAAFAPSPAVPDEFWRNTQEAAIQTLARNVHLLPSYPHPLLWEGSTYKGVWQECGPHEALVYATLSRTIKGIDLVPAQQVARNNHLAFFALQRPDGQLPASVKTSGAGFAQIQMVVPIAATAWELAKAGNDEELLTAAYNACGRWDAWLRRYRDTRQTGLVEGFCTYDTGMDNSPRWAGMRSENDSCKILTDYDVSGNVPFKCESCGRVAAVGYTLRVKSPTISSFLGTDWRMLPGFSRGHL